MIKKKTKSSQITHPIGAIELVMRLAIGVAIVLGIAHIGLLVKTKIDKRMHLRSVMASLGRIENQEKTNEAETTENLSDQTKTQPKDLGGDEESNPPQTPSGKASTDWVVVEQGSQAQESPSTVSSENNFVSPDKPGDTKFATGTNQATNLTGMMPAGQKIWSQSDLDELFAAPDFTLTRLADGNATSPLMEQEGQIIVLDFWATWCLPCLKELPKLAELFQQYDPAQVRFIAVNTEEDLQTVSNFTERRPLDIEIALDLEGKTAETFGVEELPSLVIIDSKGKVQRLHVGFQDDLIESIRTEIDSLLAGETLQGDPRIAAQLYESRSFLSASKMERPPADEFKAENRHTQDFEISLSNGESLKVAERFEQAKIAFERLLARTEKNTPSRITKIPATSGSESALILSSRGSNLHGPLASYGENGKALAYVQYQYGRRAGTLLSWDDSGRPLTLEEYKGGRKDGLTCLFKSCGGQCMSGHLWLAQEWDEGKLTASHIVLQNGSIRTLREPSSDEPQQDPETHLECGMALREIQMFEDQLESDEQQIKEAVKSHYTQVRQKLFAEVRTRMETRNVRSFAMPSFSMPTGMFGNRGSFVAAFPSMPSFSRGSMRTRNCGSS
jgi:thiol-disulfide isomerase/thioredoxin